jgi:tetratricopeptide (TPR) repeat protein
MNSATEISRKTALAARRDRTISVRVASGNYLAALFLATFVVGLLYELDYPNAGMAIFLGSWIVIPLLALTDRTTFDGNVLRRRGPLVFLWTSLRGTSSHLAVDEIESVVTVAIRTMRSAGRIYYRYRSDIASQGRHFTLVSGGRRYRDMVRTLYPLIADAKMDVRSCELRDYLVEPQGIDVSLRLLNLASASVLANAIDFPRNAIKYKTLRNARSDEPHPPQETARGILLQRVANELRVSGRWRQAGEAFRRARLLLPGDGRLLLEFARYIRSQGNALHNQRLLHRARAALRLSARCDPDNGMLLARLGETAFEFGDEDRAERLFRQALAVEPHLFRAELGLAELALREGKLAHVIHHFAAAAVIAPDAALKGFAQREIDYYSQLNQNDEYLGRELHRVSWLHHILAARRVTIRLIAVGVSLALVGSFLDETVAVIGWAIGTSALIGWCVLLAAGRMLANRRPVNPDDDNE